MPIECCFICREEESVSLTEQNNVFFRPCARNDSTTQCNIWAHQECLISWFESIPAYQQKCPTCQKSFLMEKGPADKWQNLLTILHDTWKIIKKLYRTTKVFLGTYIKKYYEDFYNNCWNSKFKIERIYFQLVRTCFFLPSLYQFNFRYPQNLNEIMIYGLMMLQMKFFFSYIIQLSDESWLKYISEEIKKEDLPPDTQIFSNVGDTQCLYELQQREEYQIYLFFKRYIPQKYKSINLHLILEATINFLCSFFMGLFLYPIYQRIPILSTYFSLEIYGDGTYLIGLYLKFILLVLFSSISFLYPRCKEIMSKFNIKAIFGLPMQNRYFPNINPKYLYHNFEKVYPEIDNNTLSPPSNQYIPCSICYQKRDLVIIPPPGPPGPPGPPPGRTCPDCQQNGYIPNTSQHRIKYMLTCVLRLTYDRFFTCLYIYKLMTYQNSLLDQFLMFFLASSSLFELLSNPFKEYRSTTITHPLSLKAAQIEVRHDVDPDNEVRLVMDMVTATEIIRRGFIETGIYRFINRYASRNIWFCYYQMVIHGVSIYYLYPMIYSYLYSQCPMDLTQSLLFSTKISIILGFLYAILVALGGGILNYIMKYSKTQRVVNPKASTN